MKPFRKHVAIAIDGGGMLGTIVCRALAHLEEHTGQPVSELFRVAAGTSTGSIISGGIACGLTAERMTELYASLGPVVFRKSLRTLLWPLTRCKYPIEPLRQMLDSYFGGAKMGDLWERTPRHDVVISAFDLTANHTCFIKPWKPQYADWPLSKAVAASCSVPTFFPPVDGQYVDGGVGSYSNPCYLAAYEIAFYLSWDARETTLISLGTGRDPHTIKKGDADRYRAWHWLVPILTAFQQSADDQQVHLVNTFFKDLDFRRFQLDLREPHMMDDASCIPQLLAYGDELWNKMLNDETDPILEMKAGQLDTDD